MVDAVLLSAGLGNVQECVDLAVENGLGIEVMAFAYPHILDGDWRKKVAEYKNLLKPVTGRITLHGPFMDMAAGSPDQQINTITKSRFRHALEIASEIGGQIVVLHANFIAAIRTQEYRENWQQRNIDFWGELAKTAERVGVTVAVENMWEFDPYIIGDVLKKVNHPYIRACVDVGHTRLYSQTPFQTWLEVMSPYLVHVHLNNNDGKDDNHRGLGTGVVEYESILSMLRAMPNPPSMTLEMDRVTDMASSLPYFSLVRQPQQD